MHRRQLEIVQPCGNDWKQMQGTSMVRYCSSCAKNVYNLSMLTEREAEAALAVRPENVCVRYGVDAGGEVIFYPEAPASRRYSGSRNALAAALTATVMATCPPAAVVLAQDNASAEVDTEAGQAPKPKGKAKKDTKDKAAAQGETCSEGWEDAFKKSHAQRCEQTSDGDVLMGGLNPAPRSGPPIAASSLRESPSRDDIVSAFRRVEPAVRACGGGPAVVYADVEISGSSGKVISVLVTGVARERAVCMEKAVRALVLPKFQQASFKVKYPFKLQG